MGVPYPTLSNYWQGRRVFPAALVKPLYLATDHDPRVAEFFVPATTATPVPDLSRTVMTLDSKRRLSRSSSDHGQVQELTL